MTTNCKMVLDKALTRPGRIDLELEFAPEPPEGPVIFGAFSSTSE